MRTESENLETEIGSPTGISHLYISAEDQVPELGQVESEGDHEEDQGTLSVHRRDFMRIFGLTTVAGAATACVRRPVEKAVPYVHQPIDETPGIAVHYASTCGACPSACGTMVKTREGRPVKIEGNSEHPVNKGGLCAAGQAELQGLYHPERFEDPQIRVSGGHWQKATWESMMPQIIEKVRSGKKVGIFTKGATGNRHKFFEEVLTRLGSTRDQLYTWESNSLFASTAEAHKLAFGSPDLPRIEFSKAMMIVGIGTDFQTTGLSPVFYAKGFSEGRSVRTGKRNTFVAFESHLTVTGSTADTRHVIPPAYESTVALMLVKALYEHPNSKGSSHERSEILKVLKSKESVLEQAYKDTGIARDIFDALAKQLIEHSSVVVCGSGASFDENATLLQLISIMANTLCGAYGTTLFFHEGWARSPVRIGDLERFVKDAPTLDVLFIIDADPVFSVPESWKLDELLGKIPTVVSMNYFPTESDRIAHFIVPSHHSLESWGDEHSIAGLWSMRQPVVRPIKATSQAEDVLLWILASVGKQLPYKDYRSYLKKQWESVYKVMAPAVAYETFFKAVIRRGSIGKLESRVHTFLGSVASRFDKMKAAPSSGFILGSTLDHRLLDGRSAHLPVLQEIGDALTTVAWDTWVAMNPNTMKEMGLQRNSLLKITGAGGSIEVAAYPLPGLHPRALVIPRGNGHEDARSTISYKNGVNPLKLFAKATDPFSSQPVTSSLSVEITNTKRYYRLAAMQKALDLDNRSDIIKTMSLDDALKKKKLTKSLDDVPDLFPKLEESPYRWGLSIDLDRCNGCGACMVACAVENNVPQTGREQVLMHREMHWIRLDRYFHGDMNNPRVSIQPVMCQHCNHAPCEGVCPVFATTHDPEGLNAMTYNRCVGTRYCANACPYKVRRFNWWTHKWGEMGERPQDRNPRPTNPDVTVRTRGVMEKCSLCIQRIRDVKHRAKAENRTVQDDEFITACAQTCPSNAIISGNLKDAASQVSRLRQEGRAYLMLGGAPEHEHFGLKTLPNVSYLSEVSLEAKKSAHAETHTPAHG
jgi:molybdopterin-containing oxidoreductase family iron-sulfur binding subunit